MTNCLKNAMMSRVFLFGVVRTLPDCPDVAKDLKTLQSAPMFVYHYPPPTSSVCPTLNQPGTD